MELQIEGEEDFYIKRDIRIQSKYTSHIIKIESVIFWTFSLIFLIEKYGFGSKEESVKSYSNRRNWI